MEMWWFQDCSMVERTTMWSVYNGNSSRQSPASSKHTVPSKWRTSGTHIWLHVVCCQRLRVRCWQIQRRDCKQHSRLAGVPGCWFMASSGFLSSSQMVCCVYVRICVFIAFLRGLSRFLRPFDTNLTKLLQLPTMSSRALTWAGVGGWRYVPGQSCVG